MFFETHPKLIRLYDNTILTVHYKKMLIDYNSFFANNEPIYIRLSF